MQIHLKRWALSAFACTAMAAHAAPMGYNGAWMAMGELGQNWREVYVNYAFTPRDAFGASTTWMRDDTGELTLTEATYTRLVQRWNAPHSQANLWFLGGVG